MLVEGEVGELDAEVGEDGVPLGEDHDANGHGDGGEVEAGHEEHNEDVVVPYDEGAVQKQEVHDPAHDIEAGGNGFSVLARRWKVGTRTMQLPVC